jgi:hypothetical protein
MFNLVVTRRSIRPTMAGSEANFIWKSAPPMLRRHVQNIRLLIEKLANKAHTYYTRNIVYSAL